MVKDITQCTEISPELKDYSDDIEICVQSKSSLAELKSTIHETDMFSDSEVKNYFRFIKKAIATKDFQSKLYQKKLHIQNRCQPYPGNDLDTYQNHIKYLERNINSITEEELLDEKERCAQVLEDSKQNYNNVLLVRKEYELVVAYAQKIYKKHKKKYSANTDELFQYLQNSEKIMKWKGLEKGKDWKSRLSKERDKIRFIDKFFKN